MNAVETIRSSLEMSAGWILGMVTDMKDAPLQAPTPNGIAKHGFRETLNQ